MQRINHIQLLASYNQWMNTKLYTACQTLSHEELLANKNAFFGSIIGTLNHIAIGDIIWLKRFAHHPAHFIELKAMGDFAQPNALTEYISSDIYTLNAKRNELDEIIINWTNNIQDIHLDEQLTYTSMKGVSSTNDFFGLIMHFFNHQTHHRGQLSTLLYQTGVDIGGTDLVTLLSENH